MKKSQNKPDKIDTTDALYRAVADYIESKGGTAIVIGGIQTIKWPTDAKYNYTLGIKITGKHPDLASRKLDGAQ